MKVAALYDVHGNLPALRAALDEVRVEGVDVLVVGGDVFPGPLAEDCLALLESYEKPVHYLRGNGENDLLALRHGHMLQLPPAVLESLAWQADRLDEDTVTFLERWPETMTLAVSLGEVLFCHATPQSDRALVTERTSVEHLRLLLEGVAAGIVVSGHTHMAFDRRVGRRRWINAGSVGMPFGTPGAHWLLLSDEATARRTSYDAAAAAREILTSSDPHARSFANSSVLSVPSAEEMLELFETS
ncbi:MAG: metallophosphoesterase family protein [Acidobacteriota bacterium]